MKKIIALICLLPIYTHADFCTEYAHAYMLAAFWKIDNVPQDIALKRIVGISILDPDSSDKINKFEDLVNNVYESNDIKSKDTDINGYLNDIRMDYVTELASCAAQHPEITIK